ncbi:hypothetical protein, partial [Rahnella ecdela]
ADSKAIVVNGDGAQVNNQGNTTVTDGATGTQITGNDATVTIKGDGITPTTIDVSDAGKGVVIAGNNANLVIDNASATADGAGSVLVDITGDDAKASLTGDIHVTNGATGIDIEGARAKVETTANIFVQDLNSVGINMTGDNATFTNTGDLNVSLNGIGANINGDNSDVVLDGNINIKGVADADGVLQMGKGIVVNGNNSSIDLKGNMSLSNDPVAPGVIAPLILDQMSGLEVHGAGNTINIEGSLSVSQTGGQSFVATNTVGADYTGVDVVGDGNTVNVQGGVNVHADSGGLDTWSVPPVNGIAVNGASTVNVTGESSVSNAQNYYWMAQFANVVGGGTLNLDKNSVLTLDFDTTDRGTWTGVLQGDGSGFIAASGTGSTINNAGVIDGTEIDAGSIMDVTLGASAFNTGTIRDLNIKNNGKVSPMMSQGGGSVTNNGDLELRSKISNPPARMGYNNNYSVNTYGDTGYAMAASTGGTATNNGTIKLEGGALYGMSAVDSNVLNTGTINLDGFIPVTDEANNVISRTAFNTPDSTAFLRGAGMIAGTAWSNATNTGNINVNNSGFGMVAINGGQLTNQGTITLTADADTVNDGTKAQLVGMGVMSGGTAINDTSGTIVINTNVGKAFYNDGTGMIINRGQIVVGEGVDPAVNNSDTVASLGYGNGSVIATAGNTTTLTSGGAVVDGAASNDGTVSGGPVTVSNTGTLTNDAAGVITSNIIVNTSGSVANQGTISGRTTVKTGGKLTNSGTMNSGVSVSGTGSMRNTGTLALRSTALNGGIIELTDSGSVVNEAGGTLILDNQNNAVHINQDGTLSNKGTMSVSASSNYSAVNIWGGTGDFINSGTVQDTSGYTGSLVTSQGDASAAGSYIWNKAEGVINFSGSNSGRPAINLTGSNFYGINDGTMNISGNNAIGMNGSKNAQLVNNGTINLGTAGNANNESGLIAMQLDGGATNDAIMENDGIINIHTNDSYAFSKLGANGRVVNTGAINIDSNVTGSGIVKQAGVTPDTTKAASYTLPVDPAAAVSQQPLRNSVSRYTVGTSANGTAGQMVVSHADLTDVQVDTGFTAGTADKTASFDNVFQGTDIQGAENIKSDTVMWNAQGQTDASGNVDVSMTKNDYRDVADSSVSSVAGALEAGYTNNALFNSLNLKSAAQVTNAMKQLSGSKATNAFNEAKVLSNRFTMLEDNAVVSASGLGFNVVAKGDQRSELGNDAQYDMLALSQKLSLTDHQTLKLQYGIARLDGSGDVKEAGDNGLTGGYSQFFGLEHAMDLGNNMSWENALRYDNHQLESSRTIQYGSVNEVANANNSQQYMEMKSQFSKGYELSDTLKFKPSVGAKVRRTRDGSVNETGANDYNLKMDAGSETAVDAIVGMELTYAGKNGWAASASVEGGPNLAYSKSARTASLQGAAGQHFNVDDDQKGGGVNSLTQVGVSYTSDNKSLGMDAYNWQEDGANDKGMRVNFKLNF